MRCYICDAPAERHHIVSRGAGGTDDEINILPLCREHHREIHAVGWQTFCRRYQWVIGVIEAAREAQGRKV